jgi:3-hydroxyacyl-CoA dehydrogenase/enoyl-CoA hydratase/3-hydroxybutyryl-CoA epimerase
MSSIQYSKENSIAVLTFDREGSPVNIFDRDVLMELDDHISEIEKDHSLTGLLIQSAKPSIFIAGADIKTLASASRDELSELLQLGQRVFGRIASLKIPTVAAIHGACAGGGCELTLACDWRVLSDAPATRIGLPETQLGILPAWGGCTRLPRLVGLVNALGLILGGKLIKVGAAKYKGLADSVCPMEDLHDHALSFLKRGKRKLPNHFLAHNLISVFLIRDKSLRAVMKKTRGLYPALLMASEVICKSVRSSSESSLAREREAFLSLIEWPQTKRMIGLFFLNERASKLKPNEANSERLDNVATVGAGVMGAGIAYWLSTRKKRLLLQDINDAALAKGMARISKLYQGSVKRRVMSRVDAANGYDRINATTSAVPLHRCDLVIEAATEDLEIKRKIFADLNTRCGPQTILATNTSALPIHELTAVIDHPDKLVGLHFFNPVHLMKLVEVVETESTSPETLASAVSFVQQIGKLPVVVKDRPGFLVNRILLPYLVEAGMMFYRGADPRVLDRAMLQFGMPMGPLRLLDEIGLDVALHVAKTLADAFPDRMRVPDVLVQMTDQGLLGRKCGAGFYLYRVKGAAQVNPQALSLQSSREQPDRIAERLAKLMSEEAALCLAEGVAATAEDIDFAMVMGTGYPPFRGGPLRYSDERELLSQKFYP